MKFRTHQRVAALKRNKSRPFLILPLNESIPLNPFNQTRDNNNSEKWKMPKKPPGLKLFTKTWPPKKDFNKNNGNDDRPLTATLEQPTILNINLIGKIDMSKVRKEFLNISNLCRLPLAITKTRRKKPPSTRPLSLLPHEKPKKTKRPETSTPDNWKYDISSRSIPRTAIKKGVSDANNNNNNNNINNSQNNNNNSKLLKIQRKRIVIGNRKHLGVDDFVTKSTKLPEPCKTCGRPDQPERFHSHPVTPLKSSKARMDEDTKIPVKNTVQKPVAIKYKSKQLSEKKTLLPTSRKSSIPSQKLAHTPPPPPVQSGPNTNEKLQRAMSAKRLLTCYICGREFGTASLPIHEPKCLEKWKRENSTLPSSLQRKPPIKPDHALTKEEWNQFAWDTSQATLVPCRNCGRTFFPDRLLVHQRSCKSTNSTTNNNGNNNSKISSLLDNVSVRSFSTPSTPGMSPPLLDCYICGKKFGSHSIKIHEKQCLKKWQAENNSLPPDLRSPEPARNIKNKNFEENNNNKIQKRVEVSGGETRTKSSPKKSPMFPCYLCGRLYSVYSIYIHEPQCLAKWKIENDKLPAHKRRPIPQKPDIQFTPDGKIDYEAVNEACWQSHLSQLVPCKACGRTFNPDRVAIHEKNCKGIY